MVKFIGFTKKTLKNNNQALRNAGIAELDSKILKD